MNTTLRTTRLPTCLALVAVALAGCADSDLEQLHEERLDDAVAARAAPPESESASAPVGVPALGGALPDERGALVLDPDEYTLVFSDEFRGLSLDGTRWNTALPWGPDVTINDERQYYADVLGPDPVERSPFSFDGESLAISATEVSAAPDTPEAQRAAANGSTWLSGVLTTAGKFDFTYGYAEARIDLPEGQGIWPAIWMLGAEPVDLRPQLYVMERDGGRPDSVFHNYEYVDADGNLRSPGQFEVTEEGLSDGFHTVGVAWSPGRFLFLLDGVPRYAIEGDDVSSQDMYLVLGLAVGGTWPGDPDETTPSPSDWTIDYVRVWQKRTPD